MSPEPTLRPGWLQRQSDQVSKNVAAMPEWMRKHMTEAPLATECRHIMIRSASGRDKPTTHNCVGCGVKFIPEPILPVSQPDFEPIAVDLARELYDRFVMGGWSPADAHAEIILMLRQWYEGFSQERDRELQQAREEIARLKETLGDTLGLLHKADRQPMYGHEMDRAIHEAVKIVQTALHPVPEKPQS